MYAYIYYLAIHTVHLFSVLWLRPYLRPPESKLGAEIDVGVSTTSKATLVAVSFPITDDHPRRTDVSVVCLCFISFLIVSFCFELCTEYFVSFYRLSGPRIAHNSNRSLSFSEMSSTTVNALTDSLPSHVPWLRRS
ncbi:hypothetical protein GGU11DRAFT_416682 [Lentinula aff. detonsa]|nr:hypothetical protein GGU11DRAFT_416682 [Lentinula aff. detonsa]